MARRALGRGLGALLSANAPSGMVDSVSEVEISAIDTSPFQPRVTFDERSMDELAQSIRSNGVIQPLLVRQSGNRFELIAGERRLRAAERAGLQRVPVRLMEASDNQVLELALIENIQREELNAIEEAQAYRKLIENVGLTQESLAERVGRDRSYITNYLRLLKLPEDVQQMVQEGKLTTGHARALLGCLDPEAQKTIADKVVKQNLSVREVERLIKEPGKASRPRAEVDPNTRDAEVKLQRRLGTKVRIVRKENLASGRIEIEFYNETDLNRLFNLLMSSTQAMY